MKIAAYVQSKQGKPLEPMHSYPRVRRFLKEKKARIVSHKPFVIRLTYDITNPITETYHLGQDTGRTNIGIAVIQNDGEIAYSAHVKTCNKDVPKHMEERAIHRRASRSGERKVRQRLAIKHNTTFPEGNIRERLLPKCDTSIKNKYIKNTESKFANRKRPQGWLTPTARHLLNTHIRSIEEACKLLPVEDITIEITRWDFARMENPGIKNWEYAKGKLFGFDSVEDAVSARQEGKCLLCGNPIKAYHHVIPKHCGGNNSIDNLCGLCEECHAKVHTDASVQETLKNKQKGVLKKYHALSVINQIMPYLLDELVKHFPDKTIYVTTGKETCALRKSLCLPDTHWIDAWCIATTRMNVDEVLPSTVYAVEQMQPYQIQQFRRNNRAIIHSERERTYKLGKTVIAKNRHTRFEQPTDSLEEWFKKTVASLGIQEAEKLRSQLQVTKSTRHYNTLGRVLPGAVFLHQSKRYVMSGQHSGGRYYRAVGCDTQNFPAKDCHILQQNRGLVYL